MLYKLKQNICEISGLSPALIYKWRAACDTGSVNSFPGKGVEELTPEQSELQRMGIASRIRPKWVQTTDGRHSWPVADNLLDQNFSAGELGRAWVSDITCILSEDGWLYLTTVMDLANRPKYVKKRKLLG